MKACSNMAKKRNLYLPINEKMSKGIFSLSLYPKLKYREAFRFTKILKNVVKTI